MAPAAARQRSSAESGRSIIYAALLLVLLPLLAWSNSFRVPFLFDDLAAIPENPTIRSLARPDLLLSPPAETTVYGRPLLNFTFALNYAISGTRVGSYHLLNLVIHIGAGLTLFGLARRTLLTDRLRDVFGQQSTSLAAAVTALWLVHPLQTESVTYIVQRAEALVGLFYFLTLYCVLRSAASEKAKAWAAAAVSASALGMATKEVMATAPFLVLLYDRTFLSGTFREALRRRPGLYGALFATLLIVLTLAAKGRAGSAGFGEGMAWYEYARTQPAILLHYLRLSLLPSRLVFDYYWPVAAGLSFLFPMLLVAALAAGAARLVWKNSPSGFAAAWFFLILAPSSSVIPVVTETAAEHRLYLPLAGLLGLLVPGAWIVLVQRTRNAGRSPSATPFLAGTAILALIFAFLTFRRNADYRSSVSIWSDTVAKRPGNVRAHYNLAKAFEEDGRIEEAVRRYRQDVLRLKPDYAEAHANLGIDLVLLGRPEEGMPHLAEALKARPDMAEAHNNMALALSRQGRTDEARQHYIEALRLRPDYAKAHYNLANLLAAGGKPEEAVAGYEEAVRLQPDLAPARVNLAMTLERLGRDPEAVPHYLSALETRPDYTKAHLNLGLLYQRAGNPGTARHHLETALRLQPDLLPARQALETLR